MVSIVTVLVVPTYQSRQAENIFSTYYKHLNSIPTTLFTNFYHKTRRNKPNQDQANKNASGKIGLILSIPSQYIEWKRNSDDNQEP